MDARNERGRAWWAPLAGLAAVVLFAAVALEAWWALTGAGESAGTGPPEAVHPAQSAEMQAGALLEVADSRRGIAVVLGDQAIAVALALVRESELTVFAVQETDAAVAEGRRAADRAGYLGTRVYVERGGPSRIGLADNLADLVQAPADFPVDREEVLRVLRPSGRARIGDLEVHKPPLPGVDDWSHPYHGPDHNAQSRDQVAVAPYLTQFLADPRYAPLPQVAVAAGGRVFKAFGHVAFKEREEPWLNQLVAFNGYNGTVLWQRDLVPGIMVHRSTVVATADVLFVGDDESCKKIDAVSGQLLGEIAPPAELAGGTFWKWMALQGGVLYALIGEQEPRDPVERYGSENHGWPWSEISEGFNQPRHPWGFGRTLLALDPGSGAVLWKHREERPVDSRAVCMNRERIFLYRPGAFLVALDAADGSEAWRLSAPEEEAAYLEESPSSLSATLLNLDRETGEVEVIGSDLRAPSRPFTWDWGDGEVSEGFFPQIHRYADPSRDYPIAVTAHYEEGDEGSVRLVAGFLGPRPHAQGSAPGLFEALGVHKTRQGWQTNWRTTHYLRCSDSVLYFSGPQVGKLLAVSAEDGRVLWEDPYDNYQLVLRDDGLYAIAGPWGAKGSARLDPLTGEVREHLDIGRRACARPSGAVDAVFFRAAGGTVRFDVASGRPHWISPMRAQCHDGVTIAGGLLYWWPSTCDCNLTLYGVTALGPAGDYPFQPDLPAAQRLERTAATVDPSSLAVTDADWPTFRADNRGTAASSAALPATAELLWSAATGSPTVTAPTAASGLVFLGGADGIVRALDASTGAERWRAHTGGEVKFPPTLWEGRALVGSGDGWVYCLEAASGEVCWRFRAAPRERRIPVYGRLLSTWPVASGVRVEQGTAYAAAGIVNYDGTHVYALDAATGTPRWENHTSGHLDPDARTGVSVQGHLLVAADRLYLAGGNAVSPAVYDTETGRCLNDPEPLASLTAKGSRGHELYRVGRRVVACGRPLYAAPGQGVFDSDVFAKLLVAPAGERDVVWIDNRILQCFPRIDPELLDRCVADREAQSWFSYQWGEFEIPGLEPLWTRLCTGSVAVAACANAVAIAGPKALVVLNLKDGEVLWSQPLPAPPVPWGLAVDRTGRAIVTLEDGRVVCFGSRP